MDGEQKFWLTFWGIVAVCMCTLIVSIATYNVINMMQMNDAITHASNPIAMSCAMGLTQACIALR